MAGPLVCSVQGDGLAAEAPSYGFACIIKGKFGGG